MYSPLGMRAMFMYVSYVSISVKSISAGHGNGLGRACPKSDSSHYEPPSSSVSCIQNLYVDVSFADNTIATTTYSPQLRGHIPNCNGVITNSTELSAEL